MPIDRKLVPAVLLVQAILSGLQCATFAHCIRWLLFADKGWERRKKINWTMTTITILVSIFSSITLGLNVKEEFLYLGGHIVEGLLTPIENSVLGISLFGTILILDAVMIWRCWATYGRSWRVTFLPIVFWSTCMVFFVITTYEGRPGTPDLPPFGRIVVISMSGFFICNILINIYTTCAITYRIMRVARASRCGQRLRSTARIMAESGMLYTSATLLYVIGFLLGDKSSAGFAFQTISGNINFAAAGISFHLLVIRTRKVGEQSGQESEVGSWNEINSK